MENFSFCSPTRFEFGRGVAKNAGRVLADLGATCVMVQYGGSSAKRCGALDDVLDSLSAAGLRIVEAGGVRPNPEVGFVREAVARAKAEGVDLVLGVGGGSVMDSVKATAIGACYEGDVWDLFEKHCGRFGHTIQASLPTACVLTIPAAGSEASNSCVLSNDALGMKSGVKSELYKCRVAFMDPVYSMTLPPYQTAAGCTDMLAHLMERFFSDSPAVPVTDNLNLSLMATVAECAAKVMEDPADYEARANIMWAGMLCHNGIAGCGRHEDWASHGLEHELSALDPSITHGAGLAVIFPAWMEYVMDQDPGRIALMGRRIFGVGAGDDMADDGVDTADAKATISALRAFFTSLGMPSRLGELGIGEGDIERMIPTLRDNKGERFGSFRKLTMDDARAIYRLAL